METEKFSCQEFSCLLVNIFLPIYSPLKVRKYIDGKLGNASQEKSQNKSQSLLKEKMCKNMRDDDVDMGFYF